MLQPIKKNLSDFLFHCNKTWLDTRQSSRGRLGRSSNAKTARNFRNICDGLTDTVRRRVACPRLKTRGETVAAQCSILQLFVPLCCLLTEYSLILLISYFVLQACWCQAKFIHPCIRTSACLVVDDARVGECKNEHYVCVRERVWVRCPIH